LTIVPDFGQVCKNGSNVLVNKQPWDVLQECVAGSYFANDSDGVRPEISIIGFPLPFSSHRERLARETGRYEIHFSRPGLPVERSHVIPDWGVADCLVFNPCDKSFLAVGIFFDIEDRSISGDREPMRETPDSTTGK
jgi:hypothetical protein